MITFNSNCTIPSSSSAYVGSPNVRGTLDILFSSVSILVLCTWSVLRLNVPIQTTPASRSQKIRKRVDEVTRKVKWMVLTLLAPEWAIGKAIVDLRSCIVHTKELQHWAHQDNVPWTRCHTCFADMGGFVLIFRQEETAQVVSTAVDPPNHLAAVSLPPLSPINLRHPQGVTAQTHPPAPPADVDIEAALTPARVASNASSQKDPSTTTVTCEAGIVSPENDKRSKWTLRGLWKRRYRNPDTSSPELQHEVRKRFREALNRAAMKYGQIAWRPHEELTSMSRTRLAEFGGTVPDNLPKGLSPLKVTSHMVALEGDVWPLTSAQLFQARHLGIIDKLPSVTEDTLKDKDKGDTLVKLTAIYQVTWLAIDLAVRQSSGLPSSPLEIMTLAFALLALFMYILNWPKPQDVRTPIYFEATRLPTPDEYVSMAVLRPHQTWTPIKTFAIHNNAMPSVKLQKNGFMWSQQMGYTGACWSSMAFGCVHLLAWNFPFPTKTEQLLWRVAAIVTAIGPAIPMVPLTAVAPLVRPWMSKKQMKPFVLGYSIPVGVWLILCRLYLLVEAYRSVYYLPPGSFVTSWTSDVPHLG